MPAVNTLQQCGENHYPVKNTFIDYPAAPFLSDFEEITIKHSKSCPNSALLQVISDTASTVDSEKNRFTPSDCGASCNGPCVQPSWSEGSRCHHEGQCRPCAFYYDPKGCGNGDKCTYCHLCPEGERKRRKKDKHAFFRKLKDMKRATKSLFRTSGEL